LFSLVFLPCRGFLPARFHPIWRVWPKSARLKPFKGSAPGSPPPNFHPIAWCFSQAFPISYLVPPYRARPGEPAPSQRLRGPSNPPFTLYIFREAFRFSHRVRGLLHRFFSTSLIPWTIPRTQPPFSSPLRRSCFALPPRNMTLLRRVSVQLVIALANIFSFSNPPPLPRVAKFSPNRS